MDELHTIVGAGAAEGAVDAANLLKPMLARGELRAVGATTLDEYKKHVEKDAALERRFQPIYVGEPTVEDTIAILRGLKERYEAHHGVTITDAALIAAATLSRPLHRRPLPARQGDRPGRRGGLARRRSSCRSVPTEIDEVERRIQQLEIELVAVARTTTADDAPRGDRARARRAARAGGRHARPVGAREGAGRGPRQAVQKRLDEARTELERAERELDYQRAAELRHGEIPRARAAPRRGRVRARTSAEPPVYLSEQASTPTRSPRSSASGPASRSPA